MDNDDADFHPLASPSRANRVHSRADKNRILVTCPECRRETFHDLVHTLEKDVAIAPYGQEPELHLYEFVQCRACDTASIIHRWTSDDGGMWTVNYYPPRPLRPLPRWMDTLRNEKLAGENGPQLAQLLDEIYQAAAAGLSRVAVMGIRALLERVMVLRVGDHGSFAKSLDAFYSRGYVGLVQRDTLANTFEIGHAAMHRFFSPTVEELNTLMDIVEFTLATLFVHPDSSVKIVDRLPPRQRQDPKAK